ncbi:MAG: DNA polymerase III subunit delta [Coriobacteriales bacterium]|jgi:DNA polymerase-3 subunit delta
MASEKPLLPAYLFLGDDKLKRDALLARMRERVAALGDLALNESVFDGPSIEPAEAVTAACSTMPFLSEKRLVVVKDIEHARKAAQDSIAAYLKNPVESTVLVMLGEKLAKNTKLYKAIAAMGPGVIVPCEAKRKRADVAQFVHRLAAKNHMNIDDSAVGTLMMLVGNDTVALDAEVTKVCGYAQSQGRNYVTSEDISLLVTKAEPPKPWEIADAISRRDLDRCMRVLNAMQGQTPIQPLSMCVQRIRELITVKSVESRPGSASLSSVLGGPDWRYKNHRSYASYFTERELIEALGKAAECDVKMKTGFDQMLCFEEWIIGVCTGNWAL